MVEAALRMALVLADKVCQARLVVQPPIQRPDTAPSPVPPLQSATAELLDAQLLLVLSQGWSPKGQKYGLLASSSPDSQVCFVPAPAHGTRVEQLTPAPAPTLPPPEPCLRPKPCLCPASPAPRLALALISAALLPASLRAQPPATARHVIFECFRTETIAPGDDAVVRITETVEPSAEYVRPPPPAPVTATPTRNPNPQPHPQRPPSLSRFTDTRT